MKPKVDFRRSFLRNLGTFRPIRKIGDVEFIFYHQIVEATVGKYSYGRLHVYSYQSKGTIEIGNFTSISEINLILGGNHHRGLTTFPLKARLLGNDASKDNDKISGIKIGHDCWIGFGVTILDGVDVSTGSIIGAGSIVTKNTEPYGIYAGSPARKVKSRFDSELIERILLSKWWDATDKTILSNIDQMYESDPAKISRFLEDNVFQL